MIATMTPTKRAAPPIIMYVGTPMNDAGKLYYIGMKTGPVGIGAAMPPTP